MLKVRMIGVVTVKDEIAVQSFGYNKYFPLGDPVLLIENLDRWGADEIFLQVIDRSENNKGPDYALIERVSELSLSTALVYSGGITSVPEGIDVIKRGADRIAINAMMISSPDEIGSLSKVLGAQAIIGVLPVSIVNDTLVF